MISSVLRSPVEVTTHLFFAFWRAAASAKLDAATNSPFDFFDESAISSELIPA